MISIARIIGIQSKSLVEREQGVEGNATTDSRIHPTYVRPLGISRIGSYDAYRTSQFERNLRSEISAAVDALTGADVELIDIEAVL